MNYNDNRFLKPIDWVEPSEDEVVAISALIGKQPQGEFSILIRNEDGSPLVIENSPFFNDGTPMPTRYWLVDRELVTAISRLESKGGIKQVQLEIDIELIQSIHDKHEFARNRLISQNFHGPKPSGGVGGTRKGVKCLHTHVANYLATNDDVVGINHANLPL